MTTTGQVEQPEDGPRRRRRLHPRDSQESAVGLMEQLADVTVGRSDSAASGLNDYATFLERADASVQCTHLES